MDWGAAAAFNIAGDVPYESGEEYGALWKIRIERQSMLDAAHFFWKGKQCRLFFDFVRKRYFLCY